jgi:hypothetical protein
MLQEVVIIIIVILFLYFMVSASENASMPIHEGPAWAGATDLTGWEIADPRTFTAAINRTVGGQSAAAGVVSNKLQGEHMRPWYDDNSEHMRPWYDDNTERFTAAIEDDGYGYF